jgi:hypothetical protein
MFFLSGSVDDTIYFVVLNDHGSCGCSTEPCDACPDNTAWFGKGSDPKICLDCNCGFCKADAMPYCKLNSPQAANNCKAAGGGGCNVSEFIDFQNSSGNACAGEEAGILHLEAGCGCVPSREPMCSVSASQVMNAFLIAWTRPH